MKKTTKIIQKGKSYILCDLEHAMRKDIRREFEIYSEQNERVKDSPGRKITKKAKFDPKLRDMEKTKEFI